MSQAFKKTVIVRWHFGKEHGDRHTIRLNSPDLISALLNQQVEKYRTTPDEAWRWYQIDENLLVERPIPRATFFGEDTRIYYLRQYGWVVIENIKASDERLNWYIHIAEIFYDQSRDCWINKDLFTDVVIEKDLHHHRVLDLNELADALDIGLIGAEDVSLILKRTDKLLQVIKNGEFVLPEIERAREACRALGW